MERRRVRQRQKRIIGAVLAAAVVILAVVIALSLGGRNRAVDEAIFEPGDNRLVVAMGADMTSFEDSEYEPEVTRIIYYHNGKNITKMEIYFEYQTEDEAKTADENITLDEKDWAESKTLNGRYIIFKVAAGQYKGLTVEEMQETIENMRAAGTLLEETKTEETAE